MNIPKILKTRISKTEWVPGIGKVEPGKPHLCFFTYVDEKGKLRKERSWKGGGDSDVADIENIPRLGYVIKDNVQRSTDWFGTGRTMFRVTHPDLELKFEITANNLLEIIGSCTIGVGGVINSPCVLAWDGANMSLIPTISPIYSDYVESTKKINKGILKPSELEVGKTYVNRRGEAHVYLGQWWYTYLTYDTIDIGYTGFLSRGKKYNHTGFEFTSRRYHAFKVNEESQRAKDYIIKLLTSPSLYESEATEVISSIEILSLLRNPEKYSYRVSSTSVYRGIPLHLDTPDKEYYQEIFDELKSNFNLHKSSWDKYGVSIESKGRYSYEKDNEYTMADDFKFKLINK